ncbi:diaminobutyrate--2-oxoglutarate transaminase [Gammaproteobacteria bacterium 45_16_T64]|nr:diaminobutyrate--2-oxoglutarate transaminase [Gammaproteobacteria bacterium 45_16_T64]
MSTEVFSQYESEVRSYCRSFPVVFSRAKGAELWTEGGGRYIDFFAGAGALNYGHNPDAIKAKLVEYLQSDNIVHGLDLFTGAKRTFLTALHEKILQPRGLDYRTQFCGPTGTNAVEAAIKIARKVTGRTGIFSFQGGFHGMTLGALAATGNQYNRGGAGVPLGNVHFMPYPHGFMGTFDSIEYMDTILSDPSSGYEKPAAMLLETVQAEGGIVEAPIEWLQRLRELCDKHDMLMIVDDIQVGCGRAGYFFSFERAGIIPDIVTLSKSISGYGLPMAIVLMKPELDKWMPGEHNGTFRGNQLAFIGGAAAIDLWETESIQQQVKDKAEYIESFLKNEIATLDTKIEIRGIGMIWGIDLSKLDEPDKADQVLAKCFEAGLVIESAGRKGQVVKLLPPLTIPMPLLEEGCGILKDAFLASLS